MRPILVRTFAVAALAVAGALSGGCTSNWVLVEESTVASRSVAYTDGGTELEGFLAYDPTLEGPRPGVLVVHAWWGLDDFTRDRAKALAKLGYVAFALDMYGTGKVTDDPQQAGAWAGAFRGDTPDAMRSRALAGLNVLAGDPRVDPTRLGAIGFCFGGTTVLELAWTGADVKGVVSFHGNPTAPREQDLPGIRSSILVCHGADDPFVKPAALRAFEKALRAAGADWQFVSYGGAVHAFTEPDADAHGIDGVAYDAVAAERSWALMEDFFAERLGR